MIYHYHCVRALRVLVLFPLFFSLCACADDSVFAFACMCAFACVCVCVCVLCECVRVRLCEIVFSKFCAQQGRD